ncbi:dihydrolipoyllysine-residue acetyltransferase [Alteromonas sp. CYL-A6]|uniref:dihydrolipoyllysine-residue acetyltransferase n=1 Tax=Alteromonas nitratireducens TaxID=3390813 RepID=UPI0034C45EB4
MTTEFILPDIGEGIVECELLEWLVAEGEHIEEDQPVAEVMTDKATVQIPAMYAGTVKKLHYQPGDIAKVHAPLFAMVRDDDASAPVAEQDNATPTADTITEAASQTQSSASSGSEDFILPDIGEGIVECEIVKWHVSEGDEIEEDQPVVEVMTDKAVVEIPAKHAGVVHKLYYKEGDIARVHEPLFALSSDAATASAPAENKPVTPAPATKPASVTSDKWQDGSFEPPVEIPGRILASPAVRRIARERDIDLTAVKGSGKKGRILKQDVAGAASTASTASQPVSAPGSVSVQGQQTVGGSRTEKVRGVQAAMARQMTASVQTIPHFTVADELIMDPLIALRKELKPVFEKQGVKLSFMPFFVKAMSLALNEFPIINSQLNDDVTELTYFDDHNIGFAVDSKIGLLVPNVKRVQDKSLFEIAREMHGIIDAAREGKLDGESLKGGTISISNIGALGGTVATPVINKPEAAIVALGKTQKLPRFDDNDNVVAQHIMTVNWSGDHRIIDGATMVKFNNLWCDYLQNPTKMLMHLR